MATKKGKIPGGGDGTPDSAVNSERERILNTIRAVTDESYAQLGEIKNLPLGLERNALVESVEAALRSAEKAAKDFVGGDVASGLILAALKTVRREFDATKALLAGSSAAGIRAQERAVQREAVLKEQKERDLVAMQTREDADRRAREADERIARGEGTEEDDRLIAEHNAKLLEEARRPILKLFEGTTSILKALRRMIRQGDWETARQNIELLERQLASFRVNHDSSAAQVAERGSQPAEIEMLNFYKGRIDQFDTEIEKFREEILKGKEAETRVQEEFLAKEAKADQALATRKEIGERYASLIESFRTRAADVFAMPIVTAEELEAAGTAFRVLGDDFSTYIKNWDQELKPIFRQNDIGNAWEELARNQRELRETMRVQAEIRREALNLRDQELNQTKAAERQERWETELPAFELSIVYAEMQVLDARLLRGERRKQAFEKIRDETLSVLVENWRGELGLRECAPSLTREQIDAGVRTERAAFDGRMRTLEERVKEYIEASETALPARLHEVVHIWRNTLARTHQLWNSDTDIGDRGVFLEEKYGPGEVKEGDAEFVAMVSAEHRMDFDMLAHTEVFRALRRRGREDQRQRAARDREERRSLPQTPQLNFVRLLEEDVFWDVRNARFWKPSISLQNFRRVLRSGKTMSDDELGNFVTDVSIARMAIASLEQARDRLTETEDILLGKRGEAAVEANIDVKDVLRTMKGYFQWKRRERDAWSGAMNAMGSDTSQSDRKQKLHEFFKGYWTVGPKALSGVPSALLRPIGDWANAQTHVRIFGRYIQWVLDENNGIARELSKQGKIPREFFVAIPEEHEERVELSSDDRAAVEHFAVESADVGEEHASDEHQTLEVGSFVAGAEGSLSMFVAEEEGEDEDSPVADASHVRENVPAYSAAGDAPRTPDAAPAPSVEADSAPAAASVSAPAATSAASAPGEGLSEIEQILAGVFPVDPNAPRPLVPVRRNIVLPSAASPESLIDRPRSEVPRPPRPAGTAAPVAPVRFESAPTSRAESAPVRPASAPSNESADPFAGFFGGGAEAPAPAPEARPVPRVEAPRPSSAESVPPVRPVAVDVRPVARPEPVIDSVAPAPARVEIPIEAPVEVPRETHAEDRVASWSRSLRNTVGRIFGGDATVAPAVVETPAARTEFAPTPEISRRTAGGVIGVLGKFFGLKAFADVPQYLPESFGDQNARALLTADILDAMGENAKTLQRAAGDPERIYTANLDVAARLDRAISTATTRDGEPLSNEMKTRLHESVRALTEQYSEQTRKHAVARSRELAGIVEQSVRVLEAPGRRGSPALRLLSKLPFNIGTNLAHGVGDFRKRFETAVSGGGDTGLVARVATVFRETWEEAMQGIRANGSLGGRVMNTAEAVAMIGSAYGYTAAVTGLEQVLSNLRSLTGSERDEMARLAAEGRLNVQEAMDGVLRRAERAMKRAA
ncbi:MAG: hypothetical protein AAB473_04860 [Patescibacteria group bacterium]